MRLARTFLLALFLAALLAGCGEGAAPNGAGAADAGPSVDARAGDTGTADTGAHDGGPGDAGFAFEPSVNKMIRDTSHHYRMLMAHRGGAGESPENTLAAYAHAAAIPVASIEIDTALSKDGVIVVFHDADLDSATNCTGPLADRTAAELSKCEVDSYSYATFPDHAARMIPTFDEVLTSLKGKTLINLDAKDVPADLLVPAIRAHGMEDQIIYQAGSIDGCRALEASYPGILCLAVVHSGAEIDTVKADLATNMVELSDVSLATKEIMDKIHGLGLKATTDIMSSYDLADYRDKLMFMKNGLDMIQSDLPTQWKPVMEVLNR